ncbi:MAG: hypothetical protein NZ551_05955 [Microscillaceae bacterium]|nr:hypothetical protein [Microscillaceae bacterium]MDW8460737.1 hypothetical protein [Cytophagales bacterium]
MRKTAISFILPVLVITLLWACSSPQGAKENQNISNHKKLPDSTILSDITNTVKNAPSPVDFVSHINQANLAYSKDLPNDTKNVNNYLNDGIYAPLNLGVYMTDLGYNALYFKVESSIEYLKACKKITDHLGILSKQNKQLFDRFEKNMDNRDSLLLIVSQSYANINNYVKNNDSYDISSLALVGSWVEGLYLSTKLVLQYKQTSQDKSTQERLLPVIYSIGGQKRSVDNLIELLSAVKNKEKLKDLLKDFQELKEIYQEVKIIDKKEGEEFIDIAEIGNIDQVNEKITLSSIAKAEVTDVTLKRILKKITDIREKIINVK